jgi:hypothetical protein
MIFLVEYDRARGTLLNISRFDDTDRSRADDVRLSLEIRLHREGKAHEVVLLEAADEDALRSTHSRYFRAPSEMLSSGG